MPRRPDPRRTISTRRNERRAAIRLRRFAVLVVLASIGVITLLLTAFGGGPNVVQTSAPASATRLLPARPTPQVIAKLADTLSLQLPVAQSRVTAIGYHAGTEGSYSLDPIGRQANAGLLTRLWRRLVGGGPSGMRWYQLSGGAGPSRSALDVGAAPGTDVYAPVDGTIVGVTPYILDGRAYGSRIDIQPATAPSLVVSLTHVDADPSLSVGGTVSAAGSRVGTVLDLSQIEKQALARYTQDAGNHVSLEVHPAATLAVP